MAKKWHRLALLMEQAGISLESFDINASALAESLFLISEKHKTPPIVDLGSGRLLVGGLDLNAESFARRVLYSLEGRGEITARSFRSACEVAARNQALKEHKKSAGRTEKIAQLSWITAEALGNARSDVFYQSAEWRKVRYKTLKIHGAKCQACGASAETTEIHVDHIKPRSTYPHLALDVANMQVLCKDCNFGKGTSDSTDWRPRR